MNKDFALKEGDQFKVGEDIFTIYGIDKKKDFTRYFIRADDLDIIDAEMDYYSGDKIILRKNQKIKCVIRKNSINNNGRILQLSKASKNVVFDKISGKLRKSKVYELSNIKNPKIKMKLEKLEDGTMILYDYLEIGIEDIKEPILEEKESVFNEDKKFIIKYKEKLKE